MTLELLGQDAGANKIVAPDGSTVEINGTSLRIKAAGVTADHLASSVAGAGLSGGAGTALALDIHEIGAETISVANDLIIFDDATDNSTKRESVSDLVGLIADGTTITASSGVMSVKANLYAAYPSLTAGEGLLKGDAVYIKSDGKAWKAKADAIATMPCVGFAAAAADAEAAVSIIGAGHIMEAVQGGGAFTVGGKTFVSAATAGATTQTAPSGASNVIQWVGNMSSAANLFVNIGETVVRPAA